MHAPGARATPDELPTATTSLAIQGRRQRQGRAALLGHASTAITLDVYAGLFEDDLDAVADALDALFTAAHDGNRTPTSADRRAPAATARSSLDVVCHICATTRW
jgi:hypothetical protein